MKHQVPAVLLSLCLVVACGSVDPIWSVEDSDTDAVTTDTNTDTRERDVAQDVATDVSPDGDAEADVEPDVSEGPTLESVHANIFADSCGGGFCHLSGQEAGGINLDLSAELEATLLGSSTASGVNLVEPGDPTSSYLFLKCNGEFGAVGGAGGQMPLGAPPLTDDQIQMLSDWINEL